MSRCLSGSLALLFISACGGTSKKAEPPPTTPLISQEEEEPYVDPEEGMIPEEKFAEISATFERKASTIGRCYPNAVEAGEVPADGKVKLSVEMVIQKDGFPKELKVLESSLHSEVLESCVLTAIGRWQFTEDLPETLPYSFSFVLRNL